jgi:hypothetical protein
MWYADSYLTFLLTWGHNSIGELDGGLLQEVTLGRTTDK